MGAALLTALLKEVQGLAWGAYDPSELTEAARRASPARHVLLLLGAGILTGAGQWLLTRPSSGNGIDITAAIWFQAGRMPTLRTLGSAVLSIVIVGMGAALGREGAPKQTGAVFGNLDVELARALRRTAPPPGGDRLRGGNGRRLQRAARRRAVRP